jgi:GT2 family glycosyltransferase
VRIFCVVLNWNGQADTEACLASLVVVRVPEGVEFSIVVVDNGSTDGSLETLPARFPGVQFVANGANLRWAGGNNRGLEVARRAGAEGVLLLNNDTTVAPDFLEALVSAVRAHPEAGLFGPTILSHDGTRIWSAGGSWSPWLGWGWHRKLGRPWSSAPAAVSAGARPERSGYLTGAALYVTSACLERIGPLDEGYYLYGEDADWCLKARAAGLECLYVPRSIVRHRVSGSSGGASPFKAYHRTRAGLRLAVRHTRPWHWLTWPWAFTLLLLLQSAAWWRRGGGSAAFAAAWQAFGDHWAGRPMENPHYIPRLKGAA